MLTSVANFWNNLFYTPWICHQKWCCSYHFTSLNIEKPACCLYFSKRAIWAFFLFTKNMRSRQCIRLGGPWRPLIRQRQFFSENLTPRILYIFSLKKWSIYYNECRLGTFCKECVSTFNWRRNGGTFSYTFIFNSFNWKLSIN